MLVAWSEIDAPTRDKRAVDLLSLLAHQQDWTPCGVQGKDKKPAAFWCFPYYQCIVFLVLPATIHVQCATIRTSRRKLFLIQGKRCHALETLVTLNFLILNLFLFHPFYICNSPTYPKCGSHEPISLHWAKNTFTGMMDNFLNLNQFLLVKVSRCEQVYRQSAVEQHPLLFNFTEKTYRKVGVKYSLSYTRALSAHRHIGAYHYALWWRAFLASTEFGVKRAKILLPLKSLLRSTETIDKLQKKEKWSQKQMFWQHIEKRLACLPCYRVLAAMSWQEYKWKLLRKRRVCCPWIWNYFIVCLFVFPGQDQTAWTSMVEQIFSGRCWRFWKGNMQRKWLKKVWGKITRVSTGGTCSDLYCNNVYEFCVPNLALQVIQLHHIGSELPSLFPLGIMLQPALRYVTKE